MAGLRRSLFHGGNDLELRIPDLRLGFWMYLGLIVGLIPCIWGLKLFLVFALY